MIKYEIGELTIVVDETTNVASLTGTLKEPCGDCGSYDCEDVACYNNAMEGIEVFLVALASEE
jgi:hypothetical protein